jgi:membrane-associated phospholipid phosphatase
MRYRSILYLQQSGFDHIDFTNWYEYVNINSRGIIPKEWYESFPSGHVGINLNLFLIPLFIKQQKQNWKATNWKKYKLIIYTFLYVLIVSASRIFSGAHFLSDVSWTYLIAFLIFLVTAIITRQVNKKKIKPIAVN